MRKLIQVVAVGMMLLASQAFAGNGDLIVDGNLGVGTTTPSAKLTVSSSSNNFYTINALNSGSVGSSYGVYIQAGTSNADYALRIRDKTSAVEYMSVLGNGNVGIGTATPGARLDLGVGPLNPPSNVSLFKVSGYAGSFDIFANTNNSLSLKVTGIGREMIYAEGHTGYVGIGTTTPAYPLQVMGSVASNTTILISDAKFKKNLLPITTPLDKVLNLTGLSYEWKTDEYKEKNFQEGRHYGVIAQEIEKVLPEVVNTAPDGTKAVAYTEIIPVLIEAIKEQQAQIELLKKQVANLQK